MAKKKTKDEQLLEPVESAEAQEQPEKKGKKKEKGKKTRAAQIIAIFAAHNFYANGLTPVELRTTLEDLGPTYVKIGQIMSSRVDLLPVEYCKELERLRQTVKPLDPALARQVIETETGKSIDEIFSVFRDEPLGSASIGQAHYGVLKDGTRVVVKVQRPGIAGTMMEDFVLLRKLAGLLGTGGDDESGQVLDLVSVIDELEKVTIEELDFRVEANNTKFFKENCIEDESVITCPTVIEELTTERIFTMTFVDGYSVSKKERMIEDGYDCDAVGKAIVENFLHQVLDAGVFHADPHQGNIMVAEGKPYWIDFGMVGRISQKDINNISNMVLSLITGDVESLVGGVMAMGAASPKTNREKLTDDATSFLSKYANATGVADIDVADAFTEITELATKHGISLPGQFTMLARSIITIEGVIEFLCPELNLFQLLTDKLMDRVKKNFDFKKTLLDAGKDVLETSKKAAKLPVLAADSLEKLSKGKAKMNLSLTDIEEPMQKVGTYVRYVVLAFIACVLFIGSCVLAGLNVGPVSTSGMPIISIAGIVFSIALAIFSVKKLANKGK